MSEFSESLKERSMAFAVAVLRLVDRLPPSPSGRVVAHQLASSATAVTANYRATCNARSRREFIAKLGVVVEEADESVCWLELLTRREMLPRHEVQQCCWSPWSCETSSESLMALRVPTLVDCQPRFPLDGRSDQLTN